MTTAINKIVELAKANKGYIHTNEILSNKISANIFPTWWQAASLIRLKTDNLLSRSHAR
jgi:hypothetical protein